MCQPCNELPTCPGWTLHLGQCQLEAPCDPAKDKRLYIMDGWIVNFSACIPATTTPSSGPRDTHNTQTQYKAKQNTQKREPQTHTHTHTHTSYSMLHSIKMCTVLITIHIERGMHMHAPMKQHGAPLITCAYTYMYAQTCS